MKRVILILTVLIMNAYAGNCHSMSDEELREIEAKVPTSIKFHSGVRCDNGIFINLSMRSGYFKRLKAGCMYETVYTRDIVLDGRHDRVVYDELGMPIKNIENMSENASCETLYLEFKSKVKDMR